MGAFDRIKTPAPPSQPPAPAPVPAEQVREVEVSAPAVSAAPTTTTTTPHPRKKRAPVTVYAQPIGPTQQPALSTLTPEQVMAASPEEMEQAAQTEAGQYKLPEAPAFRAQPVPRIEKPGFHPPIPFAGGPSAPASAAETEAELQKRLTDAARAPDVRQRAQALLNEKGLVGVLQDPQNRQATPDKIVRQWRAAVKLRHPEMTDAQAQEKAWRDMATLRTVGIWTGAGPLSPVDTDPDSLVDASKPRADVIGIDRFGVPITRMESPESYGTALLMSPGTLAVASGVPDVLAQTYLGETRDPDTETRIYEDVDLGHINPKVVRERRSFSDVARDTDQSLYAQRAERTLNAVGKEAGFEPIELSPLQKDVLTYGATGAVATLGAAGDVFTPDPATLVVAPVLGGAKLLGKTLDVADKAAEASRGAKALRAMDELQVVAGDISRRADTASRTIGPHGGLAPSDAWEIANGEGLPRMAADYERAISEVGTHAPQVAAAIEDKALTAMSASSTRAAGYVRGALEAAEKVEAGGAKASRVADVLRKVDEGVASGRLTQQEAARLVQSLADETRATTEQLSRGFLESRVLPSAPKSAALHVLDSLEEGSKAQKALAKTQARLAEAETAWAAANKVTSDILTKAGLAETRGGVLRMVRAPTTAAETRAVNGVIKAQTKGMEALQAARAQATADVLRATDKGLVLTQPEAAALRSKLTTQLSSYTFHLADKVDPLKAAVDPIASTAPLTSQQLAAADRALRTARVEARRGLGSARDALARPEVASGLFASTTGRGAYRIPIVRTARKVLDVVLTPVLGISPMAEWEKAHLSAAMRDMALRSERMIAAVGADISRLNTVEEVCDFLAGNDIVIGGRPLVTSGRSFAEDFSLLVTAEGAAYEDALDRLLSALYGEGGAKVALGTREAAKAELRKVFDHMPARFVRASTEAEVAEGIRGLFSVLESPEISPEVSKLLEGLDPAVRARTLGGWVAAETQLNREVRRLFSEGAALSETESKAMSALGEGALAPPLAGPHNDVAIMLASRRYFTPGSNLQPLRYVEAVDRVDGAVADLLGGRARAPEIPVREGDTLAGVGDERATTVMSPEELRAAREGFADYGHRGAPPRVKGLSPAERAAMDAQRAAEGLEPRSPYAGWEAQEEARVAGGGKRRPHPGWGEEARAAREALEPTVVESAPPAARDAEVTAPGARQPLSERLGPEPKEDFRVADVRRELEEQVAFMPSMVRDRLVKAVVETYKPRVPAGWGNMLTAWKLANTRGALAAKPKYFFDNYFGDIEQIYAAFGLNTALKQAQRTTLLTLLATGPTGVLRTLGIPGAELAGRVSLSWLVGSERGAAVFSRMAALGQDVSEQVGHFLSAGSMRVETSAILEGSSSKVVRVGDKVYTAQELREAAVRGGVFDTRNADVYMHGDGSFWAQFKGKAEKLGITGKRLAQGTEEIAETIGMRQRLALYVSLLEEGMTPAEAAQGVVTALYDYKYTMTTAEKKGLVQFVLPFWAYQKNANRQFLGALTSPRGMYRIKTFLAGRRASRDLLQQLALAVNKEDGDDVGILAGRIPPGDPAADAYARFQALRTRVGPKVTTYQWNRLLTGGSTDWGGADLDPGDILLLQEWTVPAYSQSMHDAYARGREAVDVGIAENVGPVGRRELLGKARANPNADPSALMPDVDTYWEVMYPPSSAEGSLSWALTGVGTVLTMVDAAAHPERNVNPLTVSQMVVDPVRSPVVGTAIQGYTNTAKPVRISKGLGKVLLGAMPFLSESIVPIPVQKGEKTRDYFFSEDYLRAAASSDPQEREQAKVMRQFEEPPLAGYTVSGAMAFALQSSGAASLVDQVYKFEDVDEQYAPDRLRSFLSGIGMQTQFVSKEQEPPETYKAAYQQMQEQLAPAEFAPGVPK